MTHQTRKTGRRLAGPIGILVTTFMVTGLAIVGCNQDDSESVLTPGVSTVTLGMAPPTLEELQAALNLTTEQKSSVQSALSRWQESYQEGASFQRRPGIAEDGSHRKGDPNLFGRRGHLTMTFLEGCAGGLTDLQFDQLIDLLVERRERHMETRKASREERRGPRGHRGGKFADELGLSEEQRLAVHDARREARQTMREAGQSYHEGNLTARAMGDLAGETLETLEGSLSAVLDDQQLAEITTRTRERAGRMADRKLGHLGDAAGRRVTFLTKVLALQSDQVAAVEAFMTELRPRVETLLAGIREGETGFPDALYEHLLIREASREALASILDDGQQARLEKLKRLKRGHRGLHLYF